MKSRQHNSMLSRLALKLQSYDFEVVYRPGVTNWADALSRNVEEVDEVHEEEPPYRLGNLVEGDDLPPVKNVLLTRKRKTRKKPLREGHPKP